MSTVFSSIFALPASNISMLMLLVKATIILIAALAITVTMRHASAGARHLVWLVTLGTLLVVPALTAWAPLRLNILPARSVSPQSAVRSYSAVRSAVNPPSDVRSYSAVRSAVSPHSAVSPQSGVPFPLTRFSALLAIWASIVLILAAWLGYGALSVRRIVRRARPLDTPEWLNPLYEIADRLEIDQAPRLLRSEDAKMPFACGVLEPTIVLPAECDSWTTDRRLAVLLHELAHVRRHDLAGHTLGRLACAIYWFHPLVWTAAKRLRSESERACDDLALACGARPSDYAEHLLDIVTSVRHDATPAVALAMARRKEFEGRMLAILDPHLRHSSPSRRQSAGLIASLALVAIVVGAAAPAPRAAPVKSSTISASAHRDGIALAPSPLIQQPTTSKLEQSRDTISETDSSYPNSPRHDVASATHDLIDNIAKSTVKQTTQRPKIEQSTFIDQKAIEYSVEKAARTATRMIWPNSEGQAAADDRPALLANVLRTDTSAELRRIAAWGLSDYAESAIAIEALSSALRRDPSASVREMAAWALHDTESGNPTAMDALMTAVRSDNDAKVRQTALWSLGEIGDQGALSVLAGALSNSNADVRMRAAWSIGRIGPKEVPGALVALLRDPDPKVREITAWALYEIQDPSTAPALNAAVKTETDKKVQIADIRALAQMGEKSVDAIRPLLDSKDPELRSIAIHALAGHGAGPWPWPWPQPRPYP